MEITDTHLVHSFMQVFTICLILLCLRAKVECFSKKVSGFYVFGDSTIDPGNNNHNFLTIYKANFPPYGLDKPDHIPTGRFCNGKLSTDYIAVYIGVKKELLPAYLLTNPNDIQELKTGVSFASAGSGFDPLTPLASHVIGLPQQLTLFKILKKKLEDAMGKEKSDDHIKKAVYFVCAGTNDFTLNYFHRQYPRVPPENYENYLLQNTIRFLQGLLAEGVAKVAIAGVPPLGCLPGMITFHDPPPQKRECLDEYSSIGREYNQKLQSAILQLNSSYPNARIYYIDIHKPMDEMIQNKQKFGFDEVHAGCCGTGTIETGFLCALARNVCPDRTKYVFFDAVHPTETAYHKIYVDNIPTIDSIVND